MRWFSSTGYPSGHACASLRRNGGGTIRRILVSDMKIRSVFERTILSVFSLITTVYAQSNSLRACFKIPWGPVFAEKAEWRGATKENIPGGSSTESQQSRAAFSAKTLRAAGLLCVACVGSVLTARCGDARTLPPWPHSKSLAAGPHVILKQALNWNQLPSLPDPVGF